MAPRAPPTTILCGWLTSQGKIAGVRYFEKSLLALPDLGWSSTYCSGSALQSGAMLARPSTSLTSVFCRFPQAEHLRQSSALLARNGNRCTRKPLSPEWLRLLDLKGRAVVKTPPFRAFFKQKSLKMRHFRGLRKPVRQRATSPNLLYLTII